MDLDLEFALGDRSCLAFIATEITLASKTLRLLDGSGWVKIGDNLFKGEDADYGVLSLEGVSFSDGVAQAAPSIALTLYPPSDEAAGDLLEDAAPDGAVNLWLGSADRTTGAPIGAPKLLFAGEIDVPSLGLGQGVCSVGLAVTSIWDRMLQPNQKVALNGAFLEFYFPGATGLNKVYLIRTVAWGSALPSSPTVSPINALTHRIFDTAAAGGPAPIKLWYQR